MDIHKLQCLATRPCATSYTTQQLTIKSLSLEYLPSESTETGEENLPQFSPETLLWAKKEMGKFLFGALSSFQNVKRVVYVIFHPAYNSFVFAKKKYLILIRL